MVSQLDNLANGSIFDLPVPVEPEVAIEVAPVPNLFEGEGTCLLLQVQLTVPVGRVPVTIVGRSRYT